MDSMNHQDDSGIAKKAVHVKWAGKTIALGTFPSAEADEKCARAKALTRAWRSTIRPKPTREWVMNELERLGVRIVSGKLGRKADDDDGERRNSASNGNFSMGGGMDMPTVQERLSQQRAESSAGVGSNGIPAAGGSLGGMPPASSGQQVNQHYEMLKLHHMNLLQELHETTMMMNMYQQQQLQQEQLRLQHASSEQQLENLIAQRRRSSMGNGGMDALYGSQRGSLGLGMVSRGSLGLGAGMGGVSHGFGGGAKASMTGLKNDNANMMAGMKRNTGNGNDGGMKRQKMDPDEED